MPAAKRKQRTPESRPPAEAAKKIRIFVIEDREIDRAGIREMINGAPERDLEHVGEQESNSTDLLELMSASRADLAIVDIALGQRLSPEDVTRDSRSNGLEAIQRIRDYFGSRVKILALSAYSQFLRRALEAGAHRFEHKGGTFDELRAVIRSLVSDSHPSRSKNIGDVVGLELIFHDDDHRIKVIGTEGDTPPVRLQPTMFVFIAYLAAARVRGLHAPIVRTSPQHFQPADQDCWDALMRIVKQGSGEGAAHPINAPTLRARLNQAVEPDLPFRADLITGPGPRNAAGNYALNPMVERNRITFTGFPKWLGERFKLF